MMDNSKLRNISTRAYEYASAIDIFRQKYAALPGDMPNATQIWGRADGGVPVSANCTMPATDMSATSSQATCNGDGDLTIGRVDAQTYEVFRAWQHLRNANIITGTYTGIAGAAGTSQELVGQNIPVSETDAIGYSLNFVDSGALPAEYFTGTTYNHLVFYGAQVSGNNFARGASVSAADTYNIDLKIDDGKPATGTLQSFNNTTRPNCASTDVSTTALYLMQNKTNKDCTLLFITGY
jgi:hypothetical protein